MACRLRRSRPLFLSSLSAFVAAGRSLVRSCRKLRRPEPESCLSVWTQERRRCVYHFHLCVYSSQIESAVLCNNSFSLPAVPLHSFRFGDAHTWNGLDEGPSVGPALKWACPSQRERIDDKTSFVSLHSRTFITALRRSDRGSEEETNERTRSNALPVGSFTRREPRQKIVFLSGAERRERGPPTILFRRCLWPPRNVFFLPYFERLCFFFLPSSISV